MASSRQSSAIWGPKNLRYMLFSSNCLYKFVFQTPKWMFEILPTLRPGLVRPWVRWVDSSSYSYKTTHSHFSLSAPFIPRLLHPTLVPSAGALGFVHNPTSLYKLCSGEACNNYMAALCSLWTREECEFSTCHRRLPVWFYRIMSVFLQAFSVSKTLLYGLWSRLLGGFSKLVSNFKGAS